MNKNNILKLHQQISNFYKLTKCAVPLDDVIFTPQSQYYDESADRKTIRKSKKNEMDLPSIEEFESHYAKTNAKYRIIYLENSADIIYNNPISFDVFKSKLLNKINLLSRKKDTLYFDDVKEQLAELEYIRDNFEKIFNPDAINIIANKYDSKDLVGPKGIDHDLGHSALDNKSPIQITDDDLKMAFDKDYKVIKTDPYTNKLVDGTMDIVNSKKLYNLILSIIAHNNPITGSISNINIFNNILADILPDLLVYYNLNGESFKNLKIEPIDFYFDSPDTIFANIILYKLKDYYGGIHPKNNDIPNIKNIIYKLLDQSEKLIIEHLNSLQGKIVSLW